MKLYQLSRDGTVNLYFFTSSEIIESKEILSSHGLAINVYNVDEVTLKSMIRNERGVMLVSGGVISGKWNLKRNSFEDLTKEKLPILVAGEQHALLKYIVILLSFGAVLFCLGILGNKMIHKRKRKDGEEKK